MKRTYRTLNDYEMQHNAVVGLFTKPSNLSKIVRPLPLNPEPVNGCNEAEEEKNLNPHRMLKLSARFILGGVFVYAGFDKILHPAAFAQVVYNYQILPDGLINVTAILLPCLELVLGTFLVIDLWMPGTVVMSNLLLITFIGALLFNMARGLDISCGCFSATAVESSMNLLTVLRDTSFLAIALYLLYSSFFYRN